jgi:hypothetical protein
MNLIGGHFGIMGGVLWIPSMANLGIMGVLWIASMAILWFWVVYYGFHPNVGIWRKFFFSFLFKKKSPF